MCGLTYGSSVINNSSGKFLSQKKGMKLTYSSSVHELNFFIWSRGKAYVLRFNFFAYFTALWKYLNFYHYKIHDIPFLT